MPLEAYSGTKAGLPYRGGLSAVALLAVSTGLAWALTVSRTAGALSERVRPPGWDISFRVPIGFEAIPQEPSGAEAVYRYRAAQAGAADAELDVARIPTRPNDTPTRVGERVLQATESFWLRAIFGQPPTRSLERLGGQEAVELIDPSIPMVVRATVLENGWAYAVSLRLTGGPMDESWYHLFTVACRSVEVGAAFRRG